MSFQGLGRPQAKYFATPLYFFRVPTGRLCGDYGTELADRNAAWEELTAVCGNMVGSVTRTLKEDSDWQMELLDESGNPVFRIRVVAETLKK